MSSYPARYDEYLDKVIPVGFTLRETFVEAHLFRELMEQRIRNEIRKLKNKETLNG